MIKLINLLVSLRRLPPLSELTGEQERLLFELKMLHDRKGSLTVADVYDLAKGKSAATSYRNLVALKEKGLLDVQVDNDDRRKRCVNFTSTARNLFSAIG